MRSAWGWALSITLLLGPDAQALTRLDRGSRLYVKLLEDRIATSPDDAGTEIKKINPYSVRSGESTELWVFDPNPLLFKYEATTVLSDTEDFKAAVEFAKQLQVLLGRFPKSGGGGDDRTAEVEGLDLNEFRDAVVGMLKNDEQMKSWIADSLEIETAKRMKEDVRAKDLPKLADAIDSGYAKVFRIWTKCLQGSELTAGDGQPISCDAPFDVRPLLQEREAVVSLARANAAAGAAAADLAKAQAALNAAEARRAIAEASLKAYVRDKKSQPEMRDAQEALDAAISEIDVAKAAKDKAKTSADGRRLAVATIQDELKTLRTTAVPAVMAEGAAGLTIRSFIAGIVGAENHVRASSSTARAFAKDVDALLTPQVIDTRPYSLQLQTITVAVKAETRYDAFLTEPVRKKRAERLRSITVSIEPYRPAFLRPGVAFVLGLLRNPTFTTMKQGDAYRIVRTDTSVTRYDVAAMLNIVPAHWAEPTFGGFFQIGISPKSDETGFYFGAGINAQSVFTFGGGLMLQQVRQLAPGLDLDTPIAKPEDLKTQNVFKPGFYVHATVTLGSK